MELAQQFDPENACVFMANADVQLTAILGALGLGNINRKFLFEALKKLNKRSVADRTLSPTRRRVYASDLKEMFALISETCMARGTATVAMLNQIDAEYFSESFKENFMTCVNDEDLGRALEFVASTWYKLRYSGEVLDNLIQTVVWYGRISDPVYEESWSNATEVYLDRVENLCAAMYKCGVRV